MWILAFIALSLYTWFIFSSFKGWNILQKQQTDRKTYQDIPFSIIIAAKDEAKNLSNLLLDFKKLNYAKNNFEVLIINDHSEDNTLQIVEEFNKKEFYKINSYSLEKGIEGKKSAIIKGVQLASHNYILTTDADCRIQENWLKIYSSNFQKYEAEFLAGPVRLTGEPALFSELQKFEFSNLIGTTAAFFGLKKPFMCNGANLGFTKKLFEKVGMNSKEHRIASGDDVFLLHHAKKYCPEKIHFLFEKEAMVYTEVNKSFPSFFYQRLRWAGKSKFYKDLTIVLVGLAVFFINFYLFVMLIASLFIASFFKILVIVFIVKFLMDFIFIVKIKRFFNMKQVLLYSFLLSLFYPFYTVFIAVISQFYKPKWKGRKI